MSLFTVRFFNVGRQVFVSQSRLMSGLGSGAGKGGGGGGSIREAGGSFGKMEAAHEEEYFYKKQREQLKKMHDDLDKEIDFHEKHIKIHQDAIERHKERMKDLGKAKDRSKHDD